MTRRTRAKPPVANGHDPSSDYVEDTPIPRLDIPGIDTRAREGLTKRRHRETEDLRAVLAETVLEYTTMKRREQIARGVHPDKAQPIVEEYDPIVAMALIAVRGDVPFTTQLSANAEVASYVRPKLKSVEVISDPDKLNDAQRRNDAAASILAMIDGMALERRRAHDAKIAEHGIVLDRPDPINITPKKTNGSGH